MRVPAQVTNLLDDLTEHLPIILGRNLVGIYLYGSLTQRAFNPKRSDIDCIVVTRRDLSEAQFKRLRAWLAEAAKSNPWVTRLQMSILIRDQLLTMNANYCLYQFGQIKRDKSDGNPIIWINVHDSGITLYGPAPESFVPTISDEIFFDALKRELNYLREELIEKPDSEWQDVPFYRAYAVLTLCRIMYSLEKGTVVSKPRAARWAIKQVPDKLRDIILQVLDSDRDSENRSATISLPRIRQFINFAAGRFAPESRRI
ncbi:MAG TPA: aminoglycoside adenylyltransferase domain-containing protein [Candidatus Binataceae bacterium]|nr:aminoglycoside adenylyltransferase domain-containing protein [Candidatus Binataceae bacterium]